MQRLRELGPTAVASLTVVVAAFGGAHSWHHDIVSFLLFFAGFILIASLTERAVSALRAKWGEISAT